MIKDKPIGCSETGEFYRVLIVDDSVFVAKQLSQILLSEGFKVAAIAENGQVGVEMYKNLSPHIDLVTMDITMPKVDGITALEQIMALNKNARVIMVSALGKEELVKKAIMLGAKGYIIKPLDRTKVLKRIAVLFNEG